MKIGIVCPYDMFRGGGVQEHVIAQAAELRRRGHAVKIVTPKPRKFDKETPQDYVFLGVSTMVKTPISTSLELGVSLGRTEVKDTLDSENFDIIHIHEPEVPMLGAQVVANATCPLIATFHAALPETAIAKTIELFRAPRGKTIFERLAKITAVSDVAAAFVSAHTKKQVVIIPNGIVLGDYEFNPSPKLSVTPNILYVGRLEKRKGVDYLLRAYKRVAANNPKIVLNIVGAGPDRAKLKQYVRRNKLDNVVFHGFVDEKTKIKLFKNADVFTSPALYGESFGIVLLEAMAAGIPVVAGDNPGYATVMRDTGRVSLVDPKDTQEFARKLSLMLEDTGLRKLWKDWAATYIKQYSYVQIVDKYEAIYREFVTKTTKK